MVLRDVVAERQDLGDSDLRVSGRQDRIRDAVRLRLAHGDNAAIAEVEPDSTGALDAFERRAHVAERLHLSPQQGVIVTDVEDNSIADAQGIEREDVITEVDGKPVTNVQSFREALNKADPKRGVLLYLDRKGSRTFAVLKAGS